MAAAAAATTSQRKKCLFGGGRGKIRFFTALPCFSVAKCGRDSSASLAVFKLLVIRQPLKWGCF